MSEGDTNTNDEGQSQATLEEVQAQIASLTEALESEKKSKERILEESKKYKEGYQSFKSEKEELAKKKKEEEEARLIKEGQFQTIIEQRESRISELEESLGSLKSEVESRDTAIVNFKKAAAFERALGGKMKRDAYWSHVDFDKIAVNPESGKIDEASLKATADGFLEEYKELVDFGNAANLPNGTPKGGTGKLTHEQWKKLPLAERRKRMKDVVH